ncbi:MAG TPA: translation elongation factor-like protein [Candidatus Paceibacterota bacterium]|nr:translation elongation factor-like protein [Candidatus Paceibacterota bacterium]
MEEKLIGKVTHYYGKIGVGIVELSGNLKVGDKIHLKGHSTDFEQEVDSIQVEHENVDSAKKGEIIGLKVKDKVKEGDEVYLILE